MNFETRGIESEQSKQPSMQGFGAFTNPSDAEIAKLLRESKNIAVVGLSNVPTKASYIVASYIQSQGYEVIPVNPSEQMVLGRKAHASLLDVEGPIDIVNVFRRSHEVADIVEQAIQVKARAVWTQLGILDVEAARNAQEAGLMMIMDRCLKIEHFHLLGKEKI